MVFYGVWIVGNEKMAYRTLRNLHLDIENNDFSCIGLIAVFY